MQVTISITADGDEDRAVEVVDAVAVALSGDVAVATAGESSEARVLAEMAAELEQTRDELKCSQDAHTTAVEAHRAALRKAKTAEEAHLETVDQIKKISDELTSLKAAAKKTAANHGRAVESLQDRITALEAQLAEARGEVDEWVSWAEAEGIEFVTTEAEEDDGQ